MVLNLGKLWFWSMACQSTHVSQWISRTPCVVCTVTKSQTTYNRKHNIIQCIKNLGFLFTSIRNERYQAIKLTVVQECLSFYPKMSNLVWLCTHYIHIRYFDHILLVINGEDPCLF